MLCVKIMYFVNRFHALPLFKPWMFLFVATKVTICSLYLPPDENIDQSELNISISQLPNSNKKKPAGDGKSF